MRKILLSMVLGLSFVCGENKFSRSDSHSTTSSSSSWEAAESPGFCGFWCDLFTCGASTDVQDEDELEVEDIENNMGSQGDVPWAQTLENNMGSQGDVPWAQTNCHPPQSAAAAAHQQWNFGYSGYSGHVTGHRIIQRPLGMNELVSDKLDRLNSRNISAEDSVALNGYVLGNKSVAFSRSDSFASEASFVTQKSCVLLPTQCLVQLSPEQLEIARKWSPEVYAKFFADIGENVKLIANLHDAQKISKKINNFLQKGYPLKSMDDVLTLQEEIQEEIQTNF